MGITTEELKKEVESRGILAQEEFIRNMVQEYGGVLHTIDIILFLFGNEYGKENYPEISKLQEFLSDMDTARKNANINAKPRGE